MLLSYIKQWSPFRIDALGIVTMLGAAEVDHTVGRLVRSRYTDFLPLLGAYTLASNQITRPIPGFVLYNITDGIMATDLNGWFTRWLLEASMTFTSSTLLISVKMNSRTRGRIIGAIILGVLANSLILLLAIITTDWWGVVNAISMALSVLVRQIILGQNRVALDASVTEKRRLHGAPETLVKAFLMMPTGEAVTIKAPRDVVINCLLTTLQPLRPSLYRGMQILGWLAFGFHVVSLGMMILFNQLITVCMLISGTLLVLYHVGDDEHLIGSHLQLKCNVATGKAFRAAAYARLKLSKEEEDSMIRWNLFPHKSNSHWWDRYMQAQADEANGFGNWERTLASPRRKPPEVTTEGLDQNESMALGTRIPLQASFSLRSDQGAVIVEN